MFLNICFHLMFIQIVNGSEESAMKTWKEVRREGKILDRVDAEDDTGVHSEFWVEYEGRSYYCKMTNGKVITFAEIDYPWSIK